MGQPNPESEYNPPQDENLLFSIIQISS